MTSTTRASFVALSLLVLAPSTACRSRSSAGETDGAARSPSVGGASTAGAATGAASGIVDSCTAVTQTEASNALGHPVKPPVRGKAVVEGGIACVFYGPSAPAGADPDVPTFDSVRVVLVTGAQGRSFFDDYKSKVQGQAQPVAGFGDQAFFEGRSLNVLKGTSYLRVALAGAPDILAAEKKLATAALPRM